ncbi:MAG: hypothetical protein V7641_3694 [Blastocatellia bacterium]
MTTSCDNTLEEISAWDKLIEGQSDLIEDLKAELKNGRPCLRIELGLLRELSEEIVVLRELRQAQFEATAYTGHRKNSQS